MTDDAELLRQYAQAGSEDAFAELVQRYLPVVFASALRQTGGDTELAKDVCQTVFIDLGRKARSLLGHDLLVGWLFTATRFAAASMVRENRRRQARESVAVSMREDNTELAEESRNSQLAFVLDTAMAELSSEDRNAILLRFFQGKPLKEVGALLGINEDAARMRVTRAVDKLHHLLKTRGVAVPAAALGSFLAAEAVMAPPAGLAAAISTAALAGTSVAAATVTATKAIAMTTLHKSIIGATIAVAITGGIYEARQAAQLRGQVEIFQQQQGPLAGQVEQLTRERDGLTSKLAVTRDENERLNANAVELLKLRGMVGTLRRELDSQKTTAAKQLTNLAEANEVDHKPGSLSSHDQLSDSGFKAPASDSVTFQGTWNGREMGRQTEGACYFMMSGNALEFQGVNTNEWYKGTFVLREDTNPKQLVGTITECPDPKFVGKAVYAIYRIEEGTLTLTGNAPGNPEPPSSFDAPGSRKFVFKKP